MVEEEVDNKKIYLRAILLVILILNSKLYEARIPNYLEKYTKNNYIKIIYLFLLTYLITSDIYITVILIMSVLFSYILYNYGKNKEKKVLK